MTTQPILDLGIATQAAAMAIRNFAEAFDNWKAELDKRPFWVRWYWYFLSYLWPPFPPRYLRHRQFYKFWWRFNVWWPITGCIRNWKRRLIAKASRRQNRRK